VLDVERPASMGGSLPAGAALAGGRLLRNAGEDRRNMLRLGAGRRAQPSAAILDSQMLHSFPESGEQAGYDGTRRKKGSKLHLAVDTLGHLLALQIMPARADDRVEVGRLAQAVQASAGQSVALA